MSAYAKLRLLVTDKCQLSCYYCHAEARRDEDSHLRLGYAGFCAVLAAGRRLNFKEVRISGGEPLLKPDLSLALVQAAWRAGYTKVGITTNGLLLPRYWPRIEALLRQGLRVSVTLNAVDENLYTRISGYNGDGLQQILKGLHLLAGDTNAKVISVVSRRNLAHLPHVLRVSAEWGLQHKVVDMVDALPGEYISVKDIEAALEANGYQPAGDCEDYHFFENAQGHRVQVPHRVYYAHCDRCPSYPCREGDLAVRVYPGGMIRSCFGASALYLTDFSIDSIAAVLARAQENALLVV
jgi:molybdenum cofactor biosynthesis enzyme MoaA